MLVLSRKIGERIVIPECNLGITVVAIKRPDGQMLFSPSPEVVLEPGDVLICLGHKDQLGHLTALAAGPAGA